MNQCMKPSHRHGECVAMLLVMCTTTHAAPADFEVQISSAQTLTVGQQLPKGTRITIGAGEHVTFIDNTRGRPVQRDCAGAYQGPVEGCKPAASKSPILSGKTRQGAPSGTRDPVD